MRCGIDLGGTKTEAVILDDTGEIIATAKPRLPKTMTRFWTRENLIHAADTHAGNAVDIGIGMRLAVAQNRQNPQFKYPKSYRKAVSRTQTGWGAKCALPMMPIALPCRKPMMAPAQARTRFLVLFWERVVAVAWLSAGNCRSAQMAVAGMGDNPHAAPRADECGPPCYCGRSGCNEVCFRAPALPATIMKPPAKNAPPLRLPRKKHRKQRPALNASPTVLRRRSAR